MLCASDYRIIVLFLLQYSNIAFSEDPPGHMQPLGSHRPGIEVEVRDTVPDPLEFYNKYIEPSVPVILKGAAKGSQQFMNWKDDAYLREKYGKWVLNVEVGKYEGSVFGRGIVVSLRFFIDKYNEREYYIISAIAPENPMRDEIMLPKAMGCGGYIELIDEVLLLYSSGSTQSALHWDDYDNLHCVLDGTKEWIMFDRESREVLPTMDNFEAYGAMDCREVDMYKYPIIQELPWHHAFLEAGDCLYVPTGWPHHVRTDGKQRSMAMAVWFGPLHHLNMTDCPEDLSQLPEFVPLGRYKSSDITKIRNTLFLSLDGLDSVTREDFMSAVLDKVNDTEAQRAFEVIDKDGDGILIEEEVENLNEEIELFSKIFLRDQSKKFEVAYQEVEDVEEQSRDEL